MPSIRLAIYSPSTEGVRVFTGPTSACPAPADGPGQLAGRARTRRAGSGRRGDRLGAGGWARPSRRGRPASRYRSTAAKQRCISAFAAARAVVEVGRDELDEVRSGGLHQAQAQEPQIGAAAGRAATGCPTISP